jgi:hypothetical protein
MNVDINDVDINDVDIEIDIDMLTNIVNDLNSNDIIEISKKIKDIITMKII